MNRLRQLKKSDWIAIALAGVLILIIAMPLSPKQSESGNTAGQDSRGSFGFREHTGQPECLCGCAGKEIKAGTWADGGGRKGRGDDYAVGLR